MKYFSCLLFLLVLLSGLQMAAGQTAKETQANAGVVPVTITAPTLLHGPGTSFTIPIQVSNTTGQGIFGYRFQLRFDKDVIVPDGDELNNFGCSAAGTRSAPSEPTCNLFPDDETLTVFWFRASPAMSGSGTLINLNFKVVGPELSVSPLQFVDFFFNEGSPSDITVDGSVTVLAATASGTSVGGRVVSALGRPLANVRVGLIDDQGSNWSAITNGFGYYNIEDVPAGRLYMLSAQTKRYTFAPRAVFVNDAITGLDIIAEQ